MLLSRGIRVKFESHHNAIALSKAKVMSFEDLVEAQTKRAEKEAN
jgi:hypothetical protein